MSRLFVENEEYGFCSLVKATERVLDKLEIENKTFTKITGAARRNERKMIDKIALREAFINAIVHNDYTREVSPVVEIYANRLVITSYGGLVEGLSKEEFFSGRSMPRNRELMRVFRDLEFVEHLGSGMNRILHAYDRSIFTLSENFLEIVFPFETEMEQVGEQVNKTTEKARYFDLELISRNTEQVTEQVKRLLIVFAQTEMTIKNIMDYLKLKHRPTVLYEYIRPAIKLGLITLTEPDSINSPTQKYRITAKGMELKKQLEGLKYE